MLDTTQTFYDNSVYKFRSVKSNVKIDIFDNTVKTDITNATVNANRFFNSTQVYNGIRYNDNYATGELGEFKLDGSMTLLPNTITTEEIGWWSVLSDVDGEFTTNPTITINMANNHSSIGLTMFYDTFSYPLKSKCYWYNGSTLIDTLEIEADTSTQVFDNPVDNYNKLVIEIEKAKPYAYVKLGEINFGITKTFAGDQIKGIKTKEYTSIMSNTVQPNELSVDIIDYEGTYNVFNPTQLIKYFKFGQSCYAYAGVLNRQLNEYEYIPMGCYYIDSANMSDGIMKLNAYGLLNLLNSQTFYSPFYTNETVAEIVDDIMGDYPYYVNPNVKDITLTGYIPLTSKKEALKYVAIACGAVIKEGRDGTIYIYQATPDFSTNQIVTEDTVYEAWNNAGLVLSGEGLIPKTVEPIPYIFTVSRAQRLGDLKTSLIGFYNRCDVEYNSYSLGSSETLYNDSITTDENGYAIIKYNGPVSVTSVVTSATYHNYADCTVINATPNTQYTVNVTGKKYNNIKSVASSYISSNDAYDEAKLTMTLDSCNQLISSSSRAKALASWYLTSLQKRKDISFSWWSIATCEAGDFINVMTSYDEMAQAQISEIQYNLVDLIATVKGVM